MISEKETLMLNCIANFIKDITVIKLY